MFSEWWDFKRRLCCEIADESAGEKVVKIGQHLARASVLLQLCGSAVANRRVSFATLYTVTTAPSLSVVLFNVVANKCIGVSIYRPLSAFKT